MRRIIALLVIVCLVTRGRGKSLRSAAMNAVAFLEKDSIKVDSNIESDNDEILSKTNDVLSESASAVGRTFAGIGKVSMHIGSAGSGLAMNVGGHIVDSTPKIASSISSSVQSGVQSASKATVETAKKVPGAVSDLKDTVMDSSAMKKVQEVDTFLRQNQGSKSAASFADLEACVGCNFVWATVKKELGGDVNTKYESLSVQSTFEEICQDMPDVFYESCDDMMDQAGYLADLFSQGLEPSNLCDLSGICGASGAEALFASSKSSLSGDVAKRLMTG